MATEYVYRLNYTANEINEKLGKVDEISSELNSNYYTKTETEDMELITIDEIDKICGFTA